MTHVHSTHMQTLMTQHAHHAGTVQYCMPTFSAHVYVPTCKVLCKILLNLQSLLVVLLSLFQGEPTAGHEVSAGQKGDSAGDNVYILSHLGHRTSYTKLMTHSRPPITLLPRITLSHVPPIVTCLYVVLRTCVCTYICTHPCTMVDHRV